jgi:hypothetical protein
MRAQPLDGTQNTIRAQYFLSRISKACGRHAYRPAQTLTGLAIEKTRFVARDVELGILLIDSLVAVYPILFRIVPHRVIPPIEQWLGFSLIHGIPVRAAGMVPNQAACHIIDLAVSRQRIQRDKEPGFVVIEFIDAGTDIWLYWKKILGLSHRDRTTQRHHEYKHKHQPTRHFTPTCSNAINQMAGILARRIFPIKGRSGRRLLWRHSLAGTATTSL